MRQHLSICIPILTAIVALSFGTPTEASAARTKASSHPKTPATSPPEELEPPTKGSTPYDPYLGSVRNVLQHLDGRRPPSMAKVHVLMQEAFQFRYSMTSAYRPKPPAVVEKRRAGDCKDKALWLAKRMNDPGIRYVIGKEFKGQRLNHAWLLWRHNNQWWVLDPARTDIPLRDAGARSLWHIPHYVYTREGSYRYGTSNLEAFGASIHNRRASR